MSGPILVRGETSKALVWCRVLAALATVVGVVVMFAGKATPGVILCIIGSMLWIALEIYNVVQRSKRMWVEDTGDGFVVTERSETRVLGDDDVTAISFTSKKLFANGVPSKMQRTCRLWVADERHPIELKNKFKLVDPDPLANLLQRLMHRTQANLERILTEGGQIKSDAWRLDNEAFRTVVDRTKIVVPVTELTECGLFDGKMCVWRSGEDDAFARFTLDSPNTCLLPLLLTKHLEQASSQRDEGDESGLGRVLFERRAKGTTRFLLFAGAFVIGLVGLGLMFDPQMPTQVIGGLVLLGSAGLGLSGFALKHSTFRCQQRGVQKAGLFGTRQLKYTEVASFTYSATRHYHNGAYVGTHINMKFQPLSDTDARPMAYNTTVNGEDAALEELRDFISRAIAARMADTVAAGQPLRWTNNLTFQPNGIEFRSGGLLGRKPPQVLLYSDYQGYGLDQGTFSLFRKGEKKAVMTETASAPNFFPGFYLLQLLLHAPDAEQALEVDSNKKLPPI